MNKNTNQNFHFLIPAYGCLTSGEKKAIRDAFIKKTEFYAAKMQVSYGRIALRNQKTRWGSCSSLGNLNFNYRLFFIPEKYMDYVIIHELAHRLEMNHSNSFWLIVEKFCPDYKTIRKELKKIKVSESVM